MSPSSRTHGNIDEAAMPIAIVGMACRLPGGATSPSKLWKLLAEGRSAWSTLDKSRFRSEAWYHPSKGHIGTSNVQGAHFLAEDATLFDTSFFNFSAEAASTMDPEIRMQLETVYEALENAGIPLEQVAGSGTSVFAGTSFRDNHDSHMRDPTCMNDGGHFVTGNGAAMIANRVSHFYDLRGASIMVDTGCSTSLTLLHLACQNLRARESSMAIVGGSGLLMNPEMFVAGTKLGIFSPQGKSFAFDARADGYGRGDGIATIILKPLADAVRDGDAIRAVIKNTSYVEAHGTGTQTGDVIEATAVGQVFGEQRSPDNPLLIGSVKTNIGHTEATSGLAAIIKVVMALEEGAIPPNINYETPNPKIALDELKLKVPVTLERWPSYGLRRASVNNFGYGGANAHAIIEHPSYLVDKLRNGVSTTEAALEAAARSRVFVWSAKDKNVVETMRRRLHEYLDGQQGQDASSLLDRLAFTLGQRRSRFPWTMSCTACTLEELEAALDESQSSIAGPQRNSGVPRLGFVFTGQGAQWHAMGKELIDVYPVFRNTLLRAQTCLYELGCPWSLVEELTRDQATSRVGQVAFSLPLSVAIQLSLIELLKSWNIKPRGVASHSSGEVSAAYAAGYIDLKAAMAIVYCRGDLTTRVNQGAQRPGGMIAIGLGPEDAAKKIRQVNSGELVVACINSPSSTTVSGDLPAVIELEATLASEGIFARRLQVEAAYHSPLMQPVAEPYAALLHRWMRPGKGADDVVYSSPTTGKRMASQAVCNPEHWVRNMLQPVEFVDSLRNLCIDDGNENAHCVDMVVEVGPHGALRGPIRQTLMLPELKSLKISYASCLTRGESAVSTMHSLVCTLLRHGYPVDLSAVNFPQTKGRGLEILTHLPPYPWNHQTRYWKEPRLSKAARESETPPHDLLGRPTIDYSPLTPTWRHIIRPRDLPWTRDHVIQSQIVFPAAGYITMAIEAIRQTSLRPENIGDYKLSDIDFVSGLVLEDDIEGVDVRVSLSPSPDRILRSQGWSNFHIQSLQSSGKWILHCEGRIAVTSRESGTLSINDNRNSIAAVHCEDRSEWVHLTAQDIYGGLAEIGLSYGPMFQNQVSALQGQGQAVTKIRVPDTTAVMPANYQQSHVLHPTTLDTLFQAAFHSMPRATRKKQTTMVPKSIRSLSVSADISSHPGSVLEMSSQLDSIRSQDFMTSATVSNEASRRSPVLTFDGLLCKSIGETQVAVDTNKDSLCFSTVWESDLNTINVADLVADNTPEKIGEIVRLLCHKAPLASILELGAGAGDCTRTVSDALSKQPDGLFRGRFVVTDPSSEKIEALRSKIGSLSYVDYRAYDIHQMYGSQDEAPDTHDMILVSAQLCRGQGFPQVMNKVRSLTKPGGKLLIHSENNGPLPRGWLNALEEVGFINVSSDKGLAVIKATAMSEEVESKQPSGTRVALVYATEKPPSDWMKQLESTITDKVKSCQLSIKPLSEMYNADDDTSVVFLEELMEPLLAQPEAGQFFHLQSLLCRFQHVVWVSRGSQVDCPRPFASLHHGLLRTLRCENSVRRHVSLDLDPDSPTWCAAATKHIASVLALTLTPSLGPGLMELEFAVRAGTLHIPRIREDSKLNSLVGNPDAQTPELSSFSEQGRDLKLTSMAPGSLENLVFDEDLTVKELLPEDCVEIKPCAVGLNFRDLAVALGQLEMQPMGFECAGVITAVGREAAEKGFQVGNRVYALFRGCFATKIRVRWIGVLHLPDFLSFAAGASLLMVHATAYHSLFEVARLRAREKILIHAGSGGVGQAAIMMAQGAGAEVFVTVGSAEKRDFIQQIYGIQRDHIFSSRDESFADDIMAYTGQNGVDVILNSLAGPLLRATWRCVAQFGRFVEIGKRDIEQENSISLAPFARCASFSSVDLMAMMDHRPEQLLELIHNTGRMVASKKMIPVTLITTYAMSDIKQAFRLMQEGKHMGKIVIEPREGDVVKAMPYCKPVKVSADGSYLLVGGLGGIGKSAAKLLVERGARNLIIVSRNAADLSTENEAFVRGLRSRSVRVELRSCNVARRARLQEVLADCASSMPPIKGVLQSAMVLRDSFFEEMTHELYMTVIQAKVHGTWNLHEPVSNDQLEFFIMLSSVSGIGGNAGQANYAAGGTFQDAVARYRSSLGLPAVSIDLGMVKNVGVLSESKNSAVADHLERAGLRPLDEAEVLQLIEAAIQFPRRSAQSSQVITGIPAQFTRSASSSFWNRDSRFVPLERMGSGSSDALNAPGSVAQARSLLSASKTVGEAKEIITNMLVTKLATDFGRPEADINPSLALTDIGVDSLIAVELRNWIVTSLDAECSIFDVMQSRSLALLVDHLVRKSRFVGDKGQTGK